MAVKIVVHSPSSQTKLKNIKYNFKGEKDLLPHGVEYWKCYFYLEKDSLTMTQIQVTCSLYHMVGVPS